MRIIDSSTVEVVAQFTEPIKSADGTPLTDLDYSSVYVISPAGTIKSAAIQQSSASGGGAQAVTLLVTAPNGQKTTLRFAATSTDTAGNESVRTPEVVLVIDRVGPAEPEGFTVA